MSIRRHFIFNFLLLMSFVFSHRGLANNNLQIEVRVTVNASTCDIRSQEGTDAIKIDFETITKKEVEKGVSKKIPYKITCSDNSSLVKLTLSGDTANFDNSLLKVVDNNNLGFEFQLDDKKFSLGAVSSSFSMTSIPSLTVTPKLNPKASNIIGGEFNSSTASLILMYE